MGISKTQVGWFLITTLAGVVISTLILPPPKGMLKRPKAWHPSNNAIIAKFEGYRRAIQNELPPHIIDLAKDSLSNSLGSFIDIGNYRIAIETHWDNERGEHKGASVFIKE